MAKSNTCESSWPDYRAVWRWHFYAGLFCIPLVILLATTGGMYLFKPQVEAWIDRPFNHLEIDHQSAASADAQITAALKANPGAQFLAYELAPSAEAAARVLLRKDGAAIRVYLHPQTLQILKTVAEEDRFMRVVRRIHGQLLIGNTGSIVVELIASWTIVMLITGVYLWWPRQLQGLAGIVFPRLHRGRKTFWRDLHAVTGIWISAFALFLLLTGLPWAKFWGSYFKEVRDLTGTAVAQQDWSVGAEKLGAEKLGASVKGVSLEHMGHDHAAMLAMSSVDFGEIDRVINTVSALNLAPPVLISPPTAGSHYWAAKSDAQNRTLRVDLVVDGVSGGVVTRENFSERHWVDRAIGTGVAAHEGQLFGWFNQLLGLITALGLLLLCVSSVVLWWRRRQVGVLGAPLPQQPPRFSWGLVIVVLALAIYLPLFGVSVLTVLLSEKFVLSRIPSASHWLGLARKTTDDCAVFE